jgi:hypothetical protein
MWIQSKLFALSGLATWAVCAAAGASQIVPLELDKLEPRSNLIVLDVVDELLDSDDSTDTVRVRIVTPPKGTTELKSFTLRLRNRGVKDFDPTLAPGDQAVFFLKSIDDGVATLAYWGSIAVNPKRQNFTIPPAKP